MVIVDYCLVLLPIIPVEYSSLDLFVELFVVVFVVIDGFALELFLDGG